MFPYDFHQLNGAQGGSWTHKTLFLRQRCFPITSLEHTWPPDVNTNTSPLEQYPTRRYAVRSVRLELTISGSQIRRNSHYPTNGFGGPTADRTPNYWVQISRVTISTMSPKFQSTYSPITIPKYIGFRDNWLMYVGLTHLKFQITSCFLLTLSAFPIRRPKDLEP